MRYYCNRQSSTSKQNIVKKAENIEKEAFADKKSINAEEKKQKEEEVVFPPGVDYRIYADSGVKMCNYTPSNITESSKHDSFEQYERYPKRNSGSEAFCGKETNLSDGVSSENSLFYDNMHGKFGVVSVPQSKDKPNAIERMMNFLQRYKGRYICMDLWNYDRIRIEKCGYLNEVDSGYIVLGNPKLDEVTMLDLSTIKYISVYCR